MRKIIIDAKIDLIPELIEIYKRLKESCGYEAQYRLLQLIRDLEKE